MTSTPTTIPTAPDNGYALLAWDGEDGEYWAQEERIFDAAIQRYQEPFLAAARIEATDRVLDIGCGNGQTTRDAARLAAEGRVLGVDLSSRMLAVARRRASEEGLDNTEYLQADAQIHDFGAGSYDVAVSRTGAMFFADPVAAFSNIGRALRPGGRLSLLVWQPIPLNDWFLAFGQALAAGRTMPPPAPDAPGPFSLSDPDRVRTILTAGGFGDVALGGRSEPMYFGRDLDDAYRFVSGLGFARFMLRDLDADAQAGALEALRTTLAEHVTADGVVYPSACWVVTARRR